MAPEANDAAPANLVLAMQVEIAAAGINAFGSYDRAVFFLIVLRQGLRRNIAAPDVMPRQLSIHAIATDYGRAYATVWRHLHALANDAYVTLERRHVKVAETAFKRSETNTLLRGIEHAFERLMRRIAIPNRPHRDRPSTGCDDGRLVAAIDLFLCSIDDGGEQGWLSTLLITCVELIEREAPGFASVGKVASRLNLVYATAGRHIRNLIVRNLLATIDQALTTSLAWRTGPHVQRRDEAMLRCLAVAITQPVLTLPTDGYRSGTAVHTT